MYISSANWNNRPNIYISSIFYQLNNKPKNIWSQNIMVLTAVTEHVYSSIPTKTIGFEEHLKSKGEALSNCHQSSNNKRTSFPKNFPVTICRWVKKSIARSQGAVQQSATPNVRAAEKPRSRSSRWNRTEGHAAHVQIACESATSNAAQLIVSRCSNNTPEFTGTGHRDVIAYPRSRGHGHLRCTVCTHWKGTTSH
jgi:hypothetical protein